MARGGTDMFGRPEMRLSEKVFQISWSMVLLVMMVAGIGFLMLYSAAGGNIDPWANRQMARFAIGIFLMLGVALTDLRFWRRSAYAIYLVAFALLIVVEVAGDTGMGAQRWIDLKIIQIQPSEIMKVALMLALARYFNGLTSEEVGKPLYLIVPILMVFAPVGLVLRQPDLGTALMLVIGGGFMFFIAGVRLWKFALVIAAGGAMVPVAWRFLHDYQKTRVLTFLNPERDPLGSGYHILQSKIAFGSGGLFGKGFLLGTQSHLNFLPEKQTDFIFTMLAEEWGLVGALFLLGLYTLLIAYGYAIGLRSRNHFGRLLALGLTANFFLFVFINMAMVMGLIPVVGVPLPLISYGGTAMLTVLISFGLILNVYVHRDLKIGRRGNVGED